MASNVTLSIYIGSGDEGIKKDHTIMAEAMALNMKKSEFVMFCVDEYFKRKQTEKRKKGKGSGD